MNIYEAIDFFNLPKDMYYDHSENGVFNSAIIINIGQHLYINGDIMTFQSGTMTMGCKSTKEEIGKILMVSNRYKEHLRKELRQKKLEKIKNNYVENNTSTE